MHPFLNVSKLTDEEILEKLRVSYNYLDAQTKLGHNPTVASIKEIIESLENERNDRMQRLVTEEYKKKFPKELDSIEIGKLEE